MPWKNCNYFYLKLTQHLTHHGNYFGDKLNLIVFIENLRYGKFAQFPIPPKRIGIDFYNK